MSNTSVSIGGASLTEAEMTMLGELLVIAYKSNLYSQNMENIKRESSPLYKHSVYLRNRDALVYEAEKCRLLSCLYESVANRPALSEFIDEVVSLLK